MVLAHGPTGQLMDLLARDAPLQRVFSESTSSSSSAPADGTGEEMAALILTEQQCCDLELLMDGAFSPLTGFMVQQTYDAVRDTCRLPDGTVWPIPLPLRVAPAIASGWRAGQTLRLLDPNQQTLLAILHVEEIYSPDYALEAEKVYGARDEPAHPTIAYLRSTNETLCIGGQILHAVQRPLRTDHQALRQTPAETRAMFLEKKWKRICAFQTRNPMHRAHLELTMRAATSADAHLLIHPVVGLTKPGDIDYETRVQVYKAILPHYPEGTAALSLLPLAMRMGGPREALWHMIIRQNYGCTHMIIGRDHAGPGTSAITKRPIYDPYAAQTFVQQFQSELKIQAVPFSNIVYLTQERRYVTEDEVKPDAVTDSISGTELRRRLRAAEPLPEWFTYPNVAAILQASELEQNKQERPQAHIRNVS